MDFAKLIDEFMPEELPEYEVPAIPVLDEDEEDNDLQAEMILDFD